jgi:DNA replication protein DnaC
VDPWSGQIKDIRGTDNDTFASQAKMQKICRERYELYLHHAEKDQREVPLPGLLVSGAVGIGKTHWLATLLVDLVHDGLTRVAFVEASELMKRLQFSYQKREEQTEQAILNELATASVLVLDDLGSYGSDNVEWIQNTLRYIFNRRYNDNLPTLISTNYPLRAKEGERRLSDVLEQRLLSRLMEMCDLVTMKGLDYRQEHAREL